MPHLHHSDRGSFLESCFPPIVEISCDNLTALVQEGLQGSYKWLELWRAVELEWTNNDANGLHFPECQLVTKFLGICIGQCWPLSDYVTTATNIDDLRRSETSGGTASLLTP